MQIDPETHVRPLIETWPTSSRTAETLLVRRDGDDVVFLSDLRYRDRTALELRISLDREDVPAVMAVRGRQGIVEGVDYRGVPVLAAVSAVPDSPWFLVARMDASEVFAAARVRLWTVVGLVGGLLLAAAAGMGTLLRRQSVQFYRERFQAARALARSEETLRCIFENAQDGILVADTETRRFTNANEAICSMLGYTREELLGSALADIHPRESLPGVEQQFARQLRGEITLAVDTPLKRKDGSVFLADINASPVRIGGRDCMIGVLRDVTERRRAEESMRSQAILLREMGRIARIGGWEFDPATGEGSWTEEVARIHDLDPADETNLETGLSFYRGESRALIEQAVREAADSGKPYDLELEIVSQKGVPKWVRTIGNPTIKDGKVVRVRGSFQDITGQKRAEERIKHLNSVLRAIRNINQLIIKEKDRNRLMLRACGLIVEARGFRSAVIGLTDGEGGKVHAIAGSGQDLDILQAMLRRGKAPACTRGAMAMRECAIHTGREDSCAGCPAAGQIDGCGVLAMPLELDGRVYGFMLASPDGAAGYDPEEHDLLREVAGDLAFALRGMDIAATLAETEEQLRQAQKLDAIGQLAGGVAHDFNNILTIQMGYCDLMKGRLNDEDPLARDLDKIWKCADRAASLTRQLLAFSRKQTLQPEVIGLNTVVANIEKLLRRLIGEDIEFVTLPAEDLGMVMADPGQIEQVIMNLAVNARDAMPEGGRLTVETANVVLDESYARGHVGAITGPHVMLAITDTGSGMDEVTRSRLFEPFYTTKAKGKGTGLGLATVYGIVKQSGGDIWVYSEIGQGTTFKIYLPCVEDQPVVRVVQEVAATRGGGELVLVVEDEPALRELFSMMAVELGYRVRVAANGDEALLVVEGEGVRPDLLITDVVMPGMSGRMLVERLVRIQPDLKVLYTSGYTDSAIVHHGVLDPETPFLPKPFGIGDLAAKIRGLLHAGE